MSNFKHKKELGQHFLKDKNIAAKIAGLGEIKKGEDVWEIGPGNGILTREILAYNAKLTGFEIDKALWERLESEFGEKLELVKKDVLHVDWERRLGAGKVKIIANIPYQITSPLLMKMIGVREHLSKIVIMIQKEVAERMRAEPGTKEYSFLSIKAQFYFKVKYEFSVKPHVFIPPPNVQSAVISLIPRDDVYELEDSDYFWRLVDSTLRSRRKTLRNNLKYIISKEQIAALEEHTEINLTRRAETFSIPEFIDLYEKVRRET
ncbi:MAG: 16S rRNA (adenine(1518)-N(6)/adenine(1519)-N(6))-dimethyltransferase RsmA [Candidatus Cloacimonetes bacterium]|nr:16S rRNA (adenine(1518)-N(6)/adenine(1519)-N(6))-dimethyltransferase RsmA [Candidatus Cloacimonadota bacterium]